MEFLEKLKEEINPKAVYILESGPFGSETLLIVMDDEDIGKVEKFLENFDIDYDVAVVGVDEFEKMSGKFRGKKLW